MNARDLLDAVHLEALDGKYAPYLKHMAETVGVRLALGAPIITVARDLMLDVFAMVRLDEVTGGQLEKVADELDAAIDNFPTGPDNLGVSR